MKAHDFTPSLFTNKRRNRGTCCQGCNNTGIEGYLHGIGTGHCRACPHCQPKTKAPFPGGVTAPVQYGPNLSALVVYLSEYQLIPVKHLAGTFNDIFGVNGPREHVGQAAVRVRIVHMDGTGLRTGGRLHWLHVASTGLLTHFRIGRGRGDIMLEAMDIAVHDC